MIGPHPEDMMMVAQAAATVAMKAIRVDDELREYRRLLRELDDLMVGTLTWEAYEAWLDEEKYVRERAFKFAAELLAAAGQVYHYGKDVSYAYVQPNAFERNW